MIGGPVRPVARAPAKVNLTLAVLGRRADGYHELDSLVAFAGIADHLALEPGDDLSLTTTGPTAGAAGPVDSNLVVRAARALAERAGGGLRLGAFHLVKRLPAAAGIGGGSSDAAAALRLLAELNGMSPGDPAILDAARATGSDIPVCLNPTMRFMRGAGERVGPALGAAPLFAVLVNPGVAVPTADVFRGLGLAAGSPLAPPPPPPPPSPDPPALIRWIAAGRNDLEAPALALAPPIGAALAALRAAEGCRLARMSGSGATVFGLFDDRRSASGAATAVRRERPDWWVSATLLR